MKSAIGILSKKKAAWILIPSFVAAATLLQAARTIRAVIAPGAAARSIPLSETYAAQRPAFATHVRLEVLGNDANAPAGSLIENSDNPTVKFVGCGGFI